MAPDEKCLEYARECVRLAGMSEDQQTRDRLFDIAREGWPPRWTGATATPLQNQAAELWRRNPVLARLW
jgi:hypothetical protein